MPIIVGGSMYYIQSILWDSLLEETDDSLDSTQASTPTYLGNPDVLHARLASVDPVMAQRLHPRDVRKVHAFLFILFTLTSAGLFPCSSLPNKHHI